MQSAFLPAVIEATEITTPVAEQSGGNQSVVILITGFVVVFLVLLLLIGIIKIYSSIVSGAQKKAKKSKSAPVVEPVVSAPAVTDVVEDNSQMDLQTVAVITAAVEAFYGKKVKVRDIRPVSVGRSNWATAGLMENIPAMRSEGLI